MFHSVDSPQLTPSRGQWSRRAWLPTRLLISIWAVIDSVLVYWRYERAQVDLCVRIAVSVKVAVFRRIRVDITHRGRVETEIRHRCDHLLNDRGLWVSREYPDHHAVERPCEFIPDGGDVRTMRLDALEGAIDRIICYREMACHREPRARIDLAQHESKRPLRSMGAVLNRLHLLNRRFED